MVDDVLSRKTSSIESLAAICVKEKSYARDAQRLANRLVQL